MKAFARPPATWPIVCATQRATSSIVRSIWPTTPPTKPAPPDVPLEGFADVGVRFGSDDGDEARFERYRDLISFVGTRAPTSRRMLESILAQEQEHAEDLVDLLEDLPKD